MKCERCGREFVEDEGFVYQGKRICEECYMELGLHPKEGEPGGTYLATHTPGGAGPRGQQGLTETQEKVYQFIKGKGKVARDEVVKHFGFSEADIDAQLAALFHSEMVKEVHEQGKVYLVSIK